MTLTELLGEHELVLDLGKVVDVRHALAVRQAESHVVFAVEHNSNEVELELVKELLCLLR